MPAALAALPAAAGACVAADEQTAHRLSVSLGHDGLDSFIAVISRRGEICGGLFRCSSGPWGSAVTQDVQFLYCFVFCLFVLAVLRIFVCFSNCQ